MEDIVRVEQDLLQEVAAGRLVAASELLSLLSPREVADIVERTSLAKAAIIYRLLSKARALEVFERLESAVQGDLVAALRDDEVTSLFAELDPDDRAQLMEELPASVATRLLHGLPRREREQTSVILGYPAGSVGRRMSPEYVSTHPDLTVAQTMERVRRGAADAETIYTVVVTDRAREIVGVVSLREVIASDADTRISAIMSEPEFVTATDPDEDAARVLNESEYLLLPVVDSELRLVGILTIDDANQILRDAQEEDAARASGAEPLRRPYLSTSVFAITRSRVVWLLVLAVSALLTVQVLDIFSATLEQQVVLALFIPLLTGTGGNTGSQAAATVIRALAVGDVRPSDVGKVLLREVQVGAMLGALLGALGFVLASLVFGLNFGIIIGFSLLIICALAATVGGAMPLLAKTIRVDPAVFSTPFISTFCDATGLIVYFNIARAVLGL